MIVKIQRPLAGNGPPLALIYDESRNIVNETVPLTDELLKIMGEAPKIYARVEIKGSTIVLIEAVEPQPW